MSQFEDKYSMQFMLRAGGLWCLEMLFINTSISALCSSSGQDEHVWNVSPREELEWIVKESW